MSTSEGRVETKESFNRADCIRHTAQSFSPWLYPLGHRVESRYLGDDLYGEPDDLFGKSRSLDEAIAQRLTDLGDPGVALTAEKLQELDEENEQARKAFGQTITDHARQLGLVETLTSDQAEARLNIASSIKLVAKIDQKYSGFNSRGWDIYPSKEDNEPILLVPVRLEEEKISFELVDLDDLYDRDPEFLLQQVRDYEEKSAMSILVDHVTYNLSLHEVPEVEILPKYMQDFAKLTASEQGKMLPSMWAYLEWVVRLGHEYANTVFNFKQTLNGSHAEMSDGRRASIENYLTHMAECPTRTTQIHDRNARLKIAYNALWSVDHYKPSFDEQTEDPVKRVLLHPSRYTVFLDRNEKRNASDKEQSQDIIDFIERTRDVTDQNQFMKALRRELPDFHATLERFREWLGTDFGGRSRLDDLISSLGKSISIASESFDLRQLQSTLGKRLGEFTFLKSEKFEGIHTSLSGVDMETTIYNRHLEALLPLLAIKMTQAEASAREGKAPLGDFYKRQIQRCQRLTQELVQFYQEKVERAGKSLQDIAKDREAVESLKEQIGLTDEEIAHLIEIATARGEKIDDEFGPRIDLYLYTGLLNALVLEKLGVIGDVRSEVFKELLKSLFPKRPEKVWQDL